MFGPGVSTSPNATSAKAKRLASEGIRRASEPGLSLNRPQSQRKAPSVGRERNGIGPPVADVIAEERRLSHAYGGRSVFGWEPAPAALDDERKAKPAFNRG
jgi:hypothetical protein